MIKGENISTGAPKTCPTCGATPKLEVLHSAAGYYIGTQCKCGPYSRKSLYYPLKEIADVALSSGQWTPR